MANVPRTFVQLDQLAIAGMLGNNFAVEHRSTLSDLRLLTREHAINLPHNRLRPLHRRGDQLVSSRPTLWSAEQIVGGLHVQARTRVLRRPSRSQRPRRTALFRATCQQESGKDHWQSISLFDDDLSLCTVGVELRD